MNCEFNPVSTGSLDHKSTGNPTLREVNHIISSGGLYGAERVILGLISSVTGYRHRVVLFDKADKSYLPFADALRDAGVAVIILEDGYGALARNARKIGALADANGLLLLHAHGYKGTLTATQARRTFSTAQVICTQHGFTNKSWKTRAFTKLETRLMMGRLVDHVICASSDIHDFYQRAGIRTEKLQYVANSVAVPSPDTPQVPYHERDIDLLYLGRLSPEKGPDLLIDALADLAAKGQRPHTVFAGNGPLLDQTRQTATERGISGTTEFLGFVDAPHALIRRARWLVLPSRTEGLPMSALEAMSRGTPVLATRVGDLPKLLSGDQGGILVKPENSEALADALTSAYSANAEAWTQFSQAAYQTVAAQYSLDRYGREIADIYDKIFASQENMINETG